MPYVGSCGYFLLSHRIHMILPYFLKSLENEDIIILISENQTMTYISNRTIREQTGF